MMTTYELAQKQVSGRSAELSNALVKQKDTILSTVNNAQDADDIENAYTMFMFAAPVWIACDYAYKYHEVKERIKQRAEKMIADEEEFLSHERKNSKVRHSTEKDIQKLRNLLVILKV